MFIRENLYVVLNKEFMYNLTLVSMGEFAAF